MPDGTESTDKVVSWILTIAVVIAIFFTLLVYMMLGMGVGERAANTFLLCMLAVAALIAAGRYWWRKHR